MSKKNAVVIGCGQIGALYDIDKDNLVLTHAKGYHLSPNTDLIFVVDKNVQVAKKVSHKYNCNYLIDYKQIPINDIDIISICIDTQFHFEVLQYLYNIKYQGLIILEKPVVSSQEHLDILKTFNKNFLDKITINYIRRFDEEYINILNRLKDGVYSPIELVDINYFGEFEHNAVHALNIMNFLFDIKPVVKYKDKKLVILSYNDIKVLFKQIDTKYLNYDIIFFTNSHKVVFENLGYKVKIFQMQESDNFDSINELKLVSEQNVLNGYILDLLKNIFNNNTFPTVYDGIYDLELIKEINTDEE